MNSTRDFNCFMQLMNQKAIFCSKKNPSIMCLWKTSDSDETKSTNGVKPRVLQIMRMWEDPNGWSSQILASWRTMGSIPRRIRKKEEHLTSQAIQIKHAFKIYIYIYIYIAMHFTDTALSPCKFPLKLCQFLTSPAILWNMFSFRITGELFFLSLWC